VGLGTAGDFYFSRTARSLVKGKNKVDTAEAPVNGEEVRSGMEEFKLAQAVRAGVSGLGFLMSVIGLWGDGY
jgi:autophagy-related protein 33